MAMLTKDGIDLNTIYYNTIVPSLEIYNEQEVQAIRETLCQDGDETILKLQQDYLSFERLGEIGKPGAKNLKYSKFQKDTEKFGLGLGYTYDWLISDNASASEIDRLQANALLADRILLFRTILDIMLQSATDGWFNGSFNNPSENMTLPPAYLSNTFLAAHTHFYTSGAASVVLADFTNAKQHIVEHGVTTVPGRWICFHNSVETQAIEDLAGCTQANRVDNPIISSVAIEGFQFRMLGIEFVETEAVPSGYLVIVWAPTGSIWKPVRFIQKNNPSGRGLVLFPGPNAQYPIVESYYLHHLAAQILRRGGGVTIQITASATYTSPTYKL